MGVRVSIKQLMKRSSAVVRRLAKVVRTADPEAAPRSVRIASGPLAGRHLLVSPNSVLWREVVRGRFESSIYDALGKHVSFESETVWDVGAYVGYHTLIFAELVGLHGKVVAFEPNLYNVDRIQRNLTMNPDLSKRVTLLAQALSKEIGSTTLVFSSEVDGGRSSGSHIGDARVPATSSVYRTFNRSSIPTTMADALLREGLVPAPSIIKIDVEGAELLVLEGMLETLRLARPILLIEVHHIRTMFYVHELLGKLDYEIELVDEDNISASRCHIVAKPRKR